ncbi:hypothetical protein F0562_022603 [Nyssa sinensis]|uniref:Uncharacterized protein n=1 Tax=Nyssa sinensis TaxID=561372 RepID=A0A5J5BTL1_9ASTE|nr:hypothetical protein F0562_022603 [Nyssa sinensis]
MEKVVVTVVVCWLNWITDSVMAVVGFIDPVVSVFGGEVGNWDSNASYGTDCLTRGAMMMLRQCGAAENWGNWLYVCLVWLCCGAKKGTAAAAQNSSAATVVSSSSPVHTVGHRFDPSHQFDRSRV